MNEYKEGISVVTITMNEEKNIISFINSHKLVADEIIVVDGGSNDNTVKIAKELGARVKENKWPGYAKQWNVGIKNARYKWILIGDADHIISEKLANEIKFMIYNFSEKYDAFFIPRRNIMFGKWVKYGGFYPDIPYPRLFKNGLGYFDEGNLVHEKLIINSDKVGRVKNDIIHNTFMNVETYIDKMNKYTTLEAKMLLEKNNTYNIRNFFNKKLYKDKSFIRRSLPLRPIVVFIYRYFLKLGFLDGKIGLYMATLSAIYEYITTMKLWQYNQELKLKN
ncbi:glycosyltransferase family 2 protein [Thermoanaerobacterium thermosaccharolyticum]|uniref:glycosyltransferase family 2 protein n=1 Tax=Thermoanaerobacterium thermosaccharolyticum TaxID=1517 RepID=UPI003D2C16A7